MLVEVRGIVVVLHRLDWSQTVHLALSLASRYHVFVEVELSFVVGELRREVLSPDFFALRSQIEGLLGLLGQRLKRQSVLSRRLVESHLRRDPVLWVYFALQLAQIESNGVFFACFVGDLGCFCLLQFLLDLWQNGRLVGGWGFWWRLEDLWLVQIGLGEGTGHELLFQVLHALFFWVASVV